MDIELEVIPQDLLLGSEISNQHAFWFQHNAIWFQELATWFQHVASKFHGMTARPPALAIKFHVLPSR